MPGKCWREPILPQRTKPRWMLSEMRSEDLRTPGEPMPAELTNFVPPRAFELDESKFNRNLRSSRRGAAAGPSGMTMEHLRPLLDDARSLHSFFLVAEQLARAQVPDGVVDFVRLGRLTALTKPDGGVRGIVAGDVVQRLVARTMSRQLGQAVQRATSPCQCAMTTKAGCECIAHALQDRTEVDPEATITSIDGVGPFDLIPRRTMLEGLQRVSAEAVPFARMFHGRRSEYLWESDSGEVHNIPQGEGGEQGDAMMPLLFSLGQHGALQDASRTLGHGEHLMAFLDDTYYVSEPARVGLNLENALWRNAGGIRIARWQDANLEPSGHQTPDLRCSGEVSASGRPNSNSVARVDVANRQTRHQIVGDAVGPSRLRCQAPQVRHGRASSPLATNSTSEGSAKRMALAVALRVSSRKLFPSRC